MDTHTHGTTKCHFFAKMPKATVAETMRAQFATDLATRRYKADKFVVVPLSHSLIVVVVQTGGMAQIGLEEEKKSCWLVGRMWKKSKKWGKGMNA